MGPNSSKTPGAAERRENSSRDPGYNQGSRVKVQGIREVLGCYQGCRGEFLYWRLLEKPPFRIDSPVTNQENNRTKSVPYPRTQPRDPSQMNGNVFLQTFRKRWRKLILHQRFLLLSRSKTPTNWFVKSTSECRRSGFY